MSKEIKELVDTLWRAYDAIEILKNENQGLKANKLDNEAEIQKLKDKINELTNKNDIDDKLKSVMEEKSNLEKEISDLKRKISKFNDYKIQTTRSLKEKDDKIKDLTSSPKEERVSIMEKTGSNKKFIDKLPYTLIILFLSTFLYRIVNNLKYKSKKYVNRSKN